MALPPQGDQSDGFAGTDRFQIVRRLGEGGMGVVFEALDREQRAPVALKLLRHIDARGIYRFKKEFRALADLEHKNLVRLGELFCEAGQWFFTMELLEGQNLLAYVRAETPETVTTSDTFRLRYDEVRLRAALRQLAQGVHALHATQRVHRDIKPSNVLVTPKDRLVLLDFGLVIDVSRGDQSDVGLAGTVAYMAPEQAAAYPVGPAADWYSVGVVLYEALVGRAPFLGAPMEVLLAKQRYEPPPPHAVARDVPGDLDALCIDLLRMEPKVRPLGREILARLGVSDAFDLSRTDSHPSLTSLPDTTPFVGRKAELETLRRAFEDTKEGHAVALFVHGDSGMGKTGLVRKFADDLALSTQGALVLWGSCYERESVPYKAFDGIVDAIAQRLSRLDPVDAALLLPGDVGILARLFPTLKRVLAVSRAQSPKVSDPQQLRSRAFQALRELLARLAERQRLVLVIDDFQWADDDSSTLLRDVLRPPNTPPLLLIATVQRTIDSTPVPTSGPVLLDGDVRELNLQRLQPEDAEELLGELLGTRRDASEIIAAASDAAGHPLFLQELSRHILASGEAGGAHLEDILSSRIQRLEEAPRHVLELLAVAGTPLSPNVTAHAASLSVDDFTKTARTLRVTHLIRSTGARGTGSIEPYHYRVRKAALANLSSEARIRYHGQLADVLEVTGEDPLGLVRHLRAAGQAEHAAKYAEKAARRSSEALAFGQAVELFRTALELGSHDRDKIRQLQRELGDALANSGRGADSAATYQAAAVGAGPAEALDLNRRASEQLFRCGKLEEGLAALGTVMDAEELKLPSTGRWAIPALLVERAKLRVRGLGFERRHESELSPRLLSRLDTFWSASVGLGSSLYVASAAVQTRCLRLALDAGEPSRIARALAVEAAYTAAGGGATRQRTAMLVAKAQSLALEVQQPYAIGVSCCVAAMALHLEGEFRQSLEMFERGEAIFRERCVGVAWELDSGHLVAAVSLACLGQIGDLCRRVPQYVREAEDRGSLYGAMALRSGHANLLWLVAGDTERARQETAYATANYSRRATILQEYMDFIANVHIDLYEGQGHAAWSRLSTRWSALRRTHLLQVQFIRAAMVFVRGSAALCAAHDLEKGSSQQRALLHAAERDARSLQREGMAWITAWSTLLHAGVAAHRGDLAQAVVLYGRAAFECDSADMALHAAVARWRQGELVGGDGGAALLTRARSYFHHESAKTPERLVAVFAPPAAQA
jgi:serine/threonine protein kinase